MGAPDSGVRVKFWASNCARHAPSCATLPSGFRYWNFPLKSAIRLHDFVAALRTELCACVEFRAALCAFVLGTQRLAAFRTELCSLSSGAARRTQRGSLAGQVQVFG